MRDEYIRLAEQYTKEYKEVIDTVLDVIGIDGARRNS